MMMVKRLYMVWFALFFRGHVAFAQDMSPREEELQTLMHQGRREQFYQHAATTLQKTPYHPGVNTMMGIMLVEERRCSEAIPYLKAGLSHAETQSWQSVWALNYLGRAYYLLEDDENAVSSWQSCLEKKTGESEIADGAIADVQHLLQLVGFDSYYANWNTVITEHFRFHFPPDSYVRQQERYTQQREDAFTSIQSFFQTHLPKKIDFFVWNATTDGQPLGWKMIGFAKPTLCVIHSRYNQTRGHELTHIISHYRNPFSFEKTTTDFINEGIAVHLDLSDQDQLALVKARLRKTEWRGIEDIHNLWNDDKAFRSYPDDLTYPLAGAFVQFLIEQEGREKFLGFFHDQRYEHAVEVYGENLETYIQAFKALVKEERHTQ